MMHISFTVMPIKCYLTTYDDFRPLSVSPKRSDLLRIVGDRTVPKSVELT
jgi:hypothetical protein